MDQRILWPGLLLTQGLAKQKVGDGRLTGIYSVYIYYNYVFIHRNGPLQQDAISSEI